MSVDISVSITEDVVDIIATPTVNIVNVTNSASINPGLYDLSQFTNTSINPFVRTSGLSSYVPTTRTISTTSPLSGGGDLSANRTLSIATANTTTTGALSSTDWNTFNGKQAPISLTTTGTGAATFVSNVLNVPTPAAATFTSLTTTGTSGASTLTAGVLNVPTYSLAGLGGVPTARTITTTSPLTGGGDMSANRTFAITQATTTADGYLSSTDWNTFNGKQPLLVSGTNIKTVNGTTILGSGDLTISTGITIGTTAITSGTVGCVLFEGTGNVVQESANLFWDNTNARLGVGTSTPTVAFEVKKTIASGAIEGIKIEVNHSSSTSAATLDFIHTQFDARARIQSIAGAGGANPTLSFIIRSTTGMSILQSGNVNIGTSTIDAGYKLDVNGTARVSGGTNGSLQFTGNYAQVLVGTNGFYISNNTGSIDFMRFISDGRIGIGTNSPNASSIMEIASTTRGFLPPRQTQAQRTAIASPAVGLQVYQTDGTEGLYINKSTGWALLL